ncbi:MAG: EAL domain-containing protein [Candidatus Thiodiazotropha weberae]|nr:EAL domain-containing protein [Candidatus Thiodiazotropha weberae]
MLFPPKYFMPGSILATTLLFFCPILAIAADASRILIIHSYSQEYPWTKGQHEGFIDGLQQEQPAQTIIKTEYLDSKRTDYNNSYADWFEQYLQIKYQDFRPDVIYVTDDNGLNFGLTHLVNLFPETPLVFSGVNDYSIQEKLDPALQTGVFEKKEIGPNLELVQQLFGQPDQVFIVGDNSNTYQAIERELRKKLSTAQFPKTIFLADNNIDNITKHLSSVEKPLVLLTTLGAMRDNSGSTLKLNDTIKKIVTSGSEIVISMEDAYLFDGVLGGYVTSGKAQGMSAASLVKAFINGVKITELPPITKSPNEYIFSDPTLQALNLKLPATIANKVTILNPRTGFYGRYKQVIISTIVILFLSLIASLILYTWLTSKKNKKLQQQSELLRLKKEQLSQSEEKYRLLFERPEEPMLVIRKNTFVIANDSAARLLGYESSLALQQIHPSVLSPDKQPDGQPSIDKANDMMEQAYKTGYHRFEWQHLKKDGTPLLIEVSLTRIPFENDFALFCIWRDITEWRNAENGLREKTTYLNSVLSASVNIGLIATDTSLKINYFNESAARIFGMEPNQLKDQSIHIFHAGHGSESKNRFNAAMQIAQEKGEYRFQLNLPIKDETRYLDARISPIRDDNQELQGYILMIEDVTRQREAERLIKFQASYDHLTNLPNRLTLLTRLQQTISRCKRHNHLGAILFIDLDNFKQVNDTLGHSVGDSLLQEVAQRMLKDVRDEDTVARLGGDEFVVLLSESGNTLEKAIADIKQVADKLNETIAQPYLIDGHEIRTTTSIGISVFPTSDETADDILRQADTAMYQAKEAGRNTFRFFSLSMQKNIEARMYLLDELHHAIEENQFKVYFQPQFDSSMQLVGVESLVRWKKADDKIIQPGDFIHLAEESGLIQPINNFVLRHSLLKQLAWKKTYAEKAVQRISVNVSAVQFNQDNFVQNILDIISQTGTDPSVLTLEITESMLLHDINATALKMKELKTSGVRFSIDDFGTGYSSLAYLKRLPISEIKIDRSFIHDMLDDPNDAAVVETIIKLATQLGMETVAEGVENKDVLDQLIDFGCQAFQGFYFSQPVAAKEFEERFLNESTNWSANQSTRFWNELKT